MNCHTRTIKIKDQVYQIYAKIQMNFEERRLTCPCCGYVSRIQKPVLKYDIKKVEEACEEAAPVIYLQGHISEILDQENYIYVLKEGNACYPVIANNDNEIMDRIFLKPGYCMTVSGYLVKKEIENRIICRQCGTEMTFMNDLHFVLENQRKIQMNEIIDGEDVKL